MARDLRTVITRSSPRVALALVSLPLISFLPRMDLDSRLSIWMSYGTMTASVWGAVVLTLVLVSVLVSQGACWRCRGREAAVHVVVLALVLGGMALGNEHLLKPALGVHRPHIVRLSEGGSLGMTPEEFYASMERPERRAHLREILEDPDFDAVALSPAVRDHWIHEAGYSLPSGHALTAMCLATYFLVMGIRFAGRRWIWLFSLLPVWAVSVAGSRVLLQVHLTRDVGWGGVLGALLGVLAIAVSWRFLTRRRTHQTGSLSCLCSSSHGS